MSRRDRQEKLRLQKISETSSPSPKREEKGDESSSGRVNPLALTTSLPSRGPPSRAQEAKHQQITALQEEIMDRKHRLDLWEEAQAKRAQWKSTGQLLGVLCRTISGLCEGQQSRKSLLDGVRKGRKGLLRWMLSWLKQLFAVIRMTLIQSQSSLS